MLGSFCSHKLAYKGARQYGIFAEILKGAPAARLPREIDASAERHIEALRAQFAGNQGAVRIGSLAIPATGRAEIARQCGCVTSHGAGRAHPVSGVGDVDRWNTEASDGCDVTGAAVGLTGERHRPLRFARHAVAVKQRKLFIQRHFFQHQTGALVR